MNFAELNATIYENSPAFYDAEFKDVLSKIVISYNLMLADNVQVSNDENQIRDVLYLKYLNDNSIRKKIGLKNYYFDREVAEDKTAGRTDLRVLTTNSFQDTAAYYVIECKRLDSTNRKGTTGLNALYVQKGIYRFVTDTYSSYYKTNGMIGFIVKTIDIHENVKCINKLLNDSFQEANTTTPISKCDIVSGFDFSYFSTHSITQGEIVIYHLMFNYSNHITMN